MSGWIKLHRSLLKWEWYDDPNTCRLFIHLILTANHEPKKWRGLTIQRGQKLTSRAKLAKETKLSQQEIRTCLYKLKSTNELTIKATKRQTVITLCKYETYQSWDDFINQRSNQQPTIVATNEQPSNEQEDNKAKTQEPISDPVGSSCQLQFEADPPLTEINGAKRAKPVPYDKIFKLYKELCPSLKQMRIRTGKRDDGAKRLWGLAGGAKDEDRAWEYLKLFFEAAQGDAWWRGEKPRPGYSNRKPGWIYLTQEETIATIMEGD